MKMSLAGIENLIVDKAYNGREFEISPDQFRDITNYSERYATPVAYRVLNGRFDFKWTYKRIEVSVSRHMELQIIDRSILIQNILDQLDKYKQRDYLKKSEEAGFLLCEAEVAVELQSDYREGFDHRGDVITLPVGTEFEAIGNGIMSFETRNGRIQGLILRMNTNTFKKLIRDFERIGDPSARVATLFGVPVFINNFIPENSIVMDTIENTQWYQFRDQEEENISMENELCEDYSTSEEDEMSVAVEVFEDGQPA
jgi:hypothetical protein